MGYLDAQRVSVVRVLEIAGVDPPVKHDPVIVGYRQQFFEIERLTHKTIGVITHDVLNLATSGGSD